MTKRWGRACLSGILSLVLAASFNACTLPGMGGTASKEPEPVSNVADSSDLSAGKQGQQNRLTGLYNLSKADVDKRPIAVMINNIKAAQDVQTGLNDADVVFECMVEGGITRLMAVFSDISSAGQLGTVRSARYTYADLAHGLDAVYVHCGSDEIYTTPHIKDIRLDCVDLMKAGSSVSFREKNGKATEHTLYTQGSKISDYLHGKNIRTTIKKDKKKTLFSFNNENASQPAGDQSCTKVTVPMSGSYVTTFQYNDETQLYERRPEGKKVADYKTGKTVKVKNVFLLYADIQLFSDKYHLKTNLTEGSGVYISQGGSTPVRWKKGRSDSGLTITQADGSSLPVNAGNSWICFVPSKQKNAVTMAGELPPSSS